MFSHLNFQFRYNPYISTYPTYMLYLVLINQRRDILSFQEEVYIEKEKRKLNSRKTFCSTRFPRKFISKPIKDFETLQFTIISFFPYPIQQPTHPIRLIHSLRRPLFLSRQWRGELAGAKEDLKLGTRWFFFQNSCLVITANICFPDWLGLAL